MKTDDKVLIIHPSNFNHVSLTNYLDTAFKTDCFWTKTLEFEHDDNTSIDASRDSEIFFTMCFYSWKVYDKFCVLNLNSYSFF